MMRGTGSQLQVIGVFPCICLSPSSEHWQYCCLNGHITHLCLSLCYCVCCTGPHPTELPTSTLSCCVSLCLSYYQYHGSLLQIHIWEVSICTFAAYCMSFRGYKRSLLANILVKDYKKKPAYSIWPLSHHHTDATDVIWGLCKAE